MPALLFSYLLILLAAILSAAQPAAPVQRRGVQFQGSLRSRLEAWDWFDANAGDSYAFLGSIARFQLSQQMESADWTVEFAVPFLLGLPDNALAGGAQGLLGLGGNYFVANQRSRNVAMVFPKQAYWRWKNLGGAAGQSLRIGRWEFNDGSELAPKNATLAALKASRIQMRLIGHFGWTHVGRSFDGLHYSFQKPRSAFHFLGAIPTRGVFQTDGWGWNKTALAYTSYSRALGNEKNAGDLRLFGVWYHDWRHVLKVDNRSAAARQADLSNISLWTWGAHYMRAMETPVGVFDVLLWGTLQHGRWGRLEHRAASGDFEAGLQPKLLTRVKPWIRGGYYSGSGDADPGDGRHGTFFQILPTPRPFARFPFFNLMNNQDAFAMFILRPHPAWTFSTEMHALRLANSRDLWMLGGGVFQPWSFGYVGRPSNGNRSLATLWDASADWRINARWTLSGYWGYANGKSVIAAIYPEGKNARFGYLELGVRF